MPKAKPEAPTTQLALRMPTEWVADLDAIAEGFSLSGLELTRSDALRMALARGIQELKAELPVKKKR